MWPRGPEGNALPLASKSENMFSKKELRASKMYEDWVGEAVVVMIHNIYGDDNGASYIVVSKNYHDKGKDSCFLYDIHRFFKIGDKIECSVDYEDKTAEEVFGYLLNRYSRPCL